MAWTIIGLPQHGMLTLKRDASCEYNPVYPFDTRYNQSLPLILGPITEKIISATGFVGMGYNTSRLVYTPEYGHFGMDSYSFSLGGQTEPVYNVSVTNTFDPMPAMPSPESSNHASVHWRIAGGGETMPAQEYQQGYEGVILAGWFSWSGLTGCAPWIGYKGENSTGIEACVDIDGMAQVYYANRSVSASINLADGHWNHLRRAWSIGNDHRLRLNQGVINQGYGAIWNQSVPIHRRSMLFHEDEAEWAWVMAANVTEYIGERGVSERLRDYDCTLFSPRSYNPGYKVFIFIYG